MVYGEIVSPALLLWDSVIEARLHVTSFQFPDICVEQFRNARTSVGYIDTVFQIQIRIPA